ncbi:AIPR family protein [Streptomyces sp. NPDC006906]|uniref:AIPR family protein n=1 Tax=Streptomyces sp. NPDC006906 TaxID=3154782 RepID=UPI0033E47A99
MGLLQLTQIQHRVEATTFPLVDMTDKASHRPDDVRINQLSRALAAFALAKRGGFSWEEATASLTDGDGDNGIDAVAVTSDGRRLLIVQSKWAQDGRGSLALDDMIKFREGISDLVQLRWHRFNDKIATRKQELEGALLNPLIRIEVIVAHTGTSACSPDVRLRMDEFITETLNDNSAEDVGSFHYLGQAELHQLLLDDHQKPRIDLSVDLADWGQFQGEPSAYYGQVSASQIADWHEHHGTNLFGKNVRVVLHDSEVNESLVTTLKSEPEAFWYYNNGITILCQGIAKSPAYGVDRRVGSFSFSGVDIVNGAQTVGAISRAARQGIDVSRARVTVRFISLEGSGDDFAYEVTRKTNTQNRITGRDFLALDSHQARLKDEFLLEGLTYVYKRGESDPEASVGCSVTEATVALACASKDVNLSTQSKREISRLWYAGERGAYAKLFNPQVTYLRIWRSVGVLRRVEEFLAQEQTKLDGRPRGIAIHSNRLLLHLAFCQLPTNKIDDPRFDWDTATADLDSLIASTLTTLIDQAEAHYPGYPASLFKNASKCASLGNEVLSTTG